MTHDEWVTFGGWDHACRTEEEQSDSRGTLMWCMIAKSFVWIEGGWSSYEGSNKSQGGSLPRFRKRLVQG